jgi:hypothetical protein
MNDTMKTGLMRGFVGAALLALLLSGGAAYGEKSQDVDVPLVELPKTGMKSGLLTAKGDTSAGISGQAYAFHSKIVFADDEGRQREWKDFKKGDYVQYRLKQERIDFLVLELPK